MSRSSDIDFDRVSMSEARFFYTELSIFLFDYYYSGVFHAGALLEVLPVYVCIFIPFGLRPTYKTGV